MPIGFDNRAVRELATRGILLAAALWLPAAAGTAATVSVGTHIIRPDQPGQRIQILVSGGEPVAGIDLFVQVGDGGAAVGGVDVGPTITGLELVTGAIFSGNNSGAFTDPTPLVWGATTTTASGYVAASGVLATLIIDATGIFAGQYPLILNPPSTGPTMLLGGGAATNLANGLLRIGVPAAADFDEDGDVDAADLTRWKFGVGLASGAVHMQGDADGDLDVDGGDFLAWQRQLGSSTPAASANSSVPEPVTFSLCVIASAAIRLIGGRIRQQLVRA